MFPLTLLSLNAPEGVEDRLPSRVPVVSLNRFNYAEKSVMGVKARRSELSSKTRGNGVLSVVELTRIELATS